MMTLRIKKFYFDAIAKGEKTFELRSTIDFYKRQIDKNPKFLTLHYQKPERLECEILSIEIVPTPDDIGPELVKTPTCYKINLKPIRMYKKK